MKTRLWAIGLMLLCTLLTSIAQVLYKKASPLLSLNMLNIITNYYLISGLVLYIVGAMIMIIAFKGGEVSVLYPIIATSYIWVSVLSVHYFNETMNLYKWIGIFAIFIGVSFVSIKNEKYIEVSLK